MSILLTPDVLRRNWRYKHREQGLALAGLQNTLVQELYDPFLSLASWRDGAAPAFQPTLDAGIMEAGTPWFLSLTGFTGYYFKVLANINTASLGVGGTDQACPAVDVHGKWYMAWRTRPITWAVGTGAPAVDDGLLSFGLDAIWFSPKLAGVWPSFTPNLAGSFWQVQWYNGASYTYVTSGKNIRLDEPAHCEMWSDGLDVYFRVTDSIGSMTPQLITTAASIYPALPNAYAYFSGGLFDPVYGNSQWTKWKHEKLLILAPAQTT